MPVKIYSEKDLIKIVTSSPVQSNPIQSNPIQYDVMICKKSNKNKAFLVLILFFGFSVFGCSREKTTDLQGVRPARLTGQAIDELGDENEADWQGDYSTNEGLLSVEQSEAEVQSNESKNDDNMISLLNTRNTSTNVGGGGNTDSLSYRIWITSIRCRNSQERSDDIRLFVNNKRVWEIHGISSGDVRTLTDVSTIVTGDTATFKLEELDYFSNDDLGSVTFNLSDVVDQPVMCKGITGSSWLTEWDYSVCFKVESTRPENNCNASDSTDCVARYLFVPFCWSHKNVMSYDSSTGNWSEAGSVLFSDVASRDQEYYDGIKRIRTFFQEKNKLTECGDMPNATAAQTHWFEVVSPSFMEGYDPPCHIDYNNTPDERSFNLSTLLAYINNPANTPYLTKEWDVLVLVTDNYVYGDGVPGMLDSNSNSPVIYMRNGGSESFFPGEPIIFAHEWGHSRGLGDEYRHELNKPNTVNAEAGCDPAGDCCSYTSQTLLRIGYPAPNLCLGNIALDISNWTWNEDPGLPEPYDTDFFNQKYDRPDSSEGFNENIIRGRCIMSRTGAHGTLDKRGWCRSCLEHLKEKGVACDSAMGSTQIFPQVTRALEVSGEVTSSGLTTVGFSSVGMTRLPVLPANSEGVIHIVVSDINDLNIYQFGISNPKFSDLTQYNYSDDLTKDKYSFYQRIPLTNYEGPLRFTTYVENNNASQVTIGGSPPVAVANDVTEECQSPLGTTIELDGSSSYDPDGDTLFFSWNTEQAQLYNTDTSSPYGLFQLGTEFVTMKVTDGTKEGSSSTILVTVEDTTPPEFVDLEDIVFTTCDTQVTYTFLTPEVRDTCGEATVIDGQIISINGKPLAQSINILNSTLTINAGVYQVQWTAQDDNGNSFVAIQNIVIKNGIRATSSIDVKDYGKIVQTSGQAAPVFNSGSGIVEIGAHSSSGSIFSLGNVFLRSHAFVSGVIQSSGSVFMQNNVVLTNPGTVSQNSQIEFASLWDDNLLWLDFMAPQNQNMIFNPSAVAYTLTPGSYGNTTLNSGSTVVLSSGIYYFSSLTINSSSKMIIDESNGEVVIFINSGFVFREPFVDMNDELASIYLGYTGTADAVMDSAPFKGAIVAPFARLKLGQNFPLTFQGRFMAKHIEIARSVTLICDENAVLYYWKL